MKYIITIIMMLITINCFGIDNNPNRPIEVEYKQVNDSTISCTYTDKNNDLYGYFFYTTKWSKPITHMLDKPYEAIKQKEIPAKLPYKETTTYNKFINRQ